MYPDLSYILHALFGTDPDNAFSIVKTFGLLLGCAVFCSGWMLYYELIRKEAAGQLQGRMETVIIYKPVSWTDILTQTLVNFIIGYKFGLAYRDFASFQADPAAAVFSTKGYMPAGLLLGFLAFGYWYFKKERQTDRETKTKTMLVRPVDRLYDITALAAISGIVGSGELWRLCKGSHRQLFFRQRPHDLWRPDIGLYRGIPVHQVQGP
jgi:hypothetical protein